MGSRGSQHAGRDVVQYKPLPNIRKLVQAHRMVQPAVAFRRQPRVLFQPRGRGEQLVFGNGCIVLAVSEIYRYLDVGQPVIRRRGAWSTARAAAAMS